MRKASALVAIVLVVFMAAGGGLAGYDIFLKIDGIAGESQDDKHKDEIEVLSWTWAMAQTGTDPRTTGRVGFQDLAIVKLLDKATPKLFQAVTTGQHLKVATLTLRQHGAFQLEYLKITMSDIIVTSLSHDAKASGNEPRPFEQFSLNFGKIEMEYTIQNADGSPGPKVPAGYDLIFNKGL